MTWDIAPPPELTVSTRTDYVDVAAEAREAQQLEKDAPEIEAITECLSTGSKKQTAIIEHCQPLKFGKNSVRRVLMHYSSKLWKCERLFQKNAWQYTLITKQDYHR
jgi:hypothetical protein